VTRFRNPNLGTYPWALACLGLGAGLTVGACLAACAPSSRGGSEPNRTPSTIDVGHVPEGPPPAPSSASPSPGASSERGPAFPHWIGSWRSSSCGERSYERWLDIATDGTFTADDRVSPCPPTVTCVWSGIVHRKGSYQVSADDLQLALQDTSASGGPKVAALPIGLTWDPVARAPVEASGNVRCTYQRR
jgi:hypothetical protein